MDSKQQARSQLLVQRTCFALLLLALSSGHFARCQFLQPHSHLGRLVQSITSPLVLASTSSGGGGGDSDSYDSDSSPGPGPSEASGAPADPADGQRYRQPLAVAPQRQAHQYYGQPREVSSGGAGDGHFQHYEPQHVQRARQQQHSVGLQQAPSQQRGIPQQYYRDGDSSADSHDDQDSGAPTNHHKQQADHEAYQMGAYLGPSMDDKEIQGAFNSNDDKDDDEASGYEGPPSTGGSARGPGAYAASQQEAAGYSPQTGGYGGPSEGPMMGGYGAAAAADGPSGRGPRGEQANFDDELGADEDDEPAARPASGRQPRFRSSSSMSQAAASQYHQRQPGYGGGAASARQQQQQQQAGMMAAANGYSPMGAGPFDLSSLMAAAGGAPNGAQAYEVYNGDGSYSGQDYYPQQGNGRRGGARNQVASMNMPYAYQGGSPYGPMGMQQANGNGGRNADQEDAENDQDED